MNENTLPLPTLEKATENNVKITQTVKELADARIAESQKDSTLDVPTPLQRAENLHNNIVTAILDITAEKMAEDRIAKGVENAGAYTKDETMAAMVAQKVDMKLTERGAPAHEKVGHTVAYLKTRGPNG